MKMLSLFSGIGAFEQALTNLSFEYELVGYCEIDKYASKSYAAIHNVSEDMNLGDITKVDVESLPDDIDLVTYGFPCQDISIAGKQKGLLGGTRSGLFFEALRIIEGTKPRVAIAENVKNLVGKKFKEQFQIVLDSLDGAGYNNYYAVLNAKDFGVPQNRERVFIVSIRKDIDDGLFEFPQGFPLELRLKDVLEDEVDEKYYLSNKGTDGLLKALTDGRGHKPKIMDDQTEYSPTIDTKVGEQTHRSPYISDPIRLGGIYDTETTRRQAGAVWDKEAIAPTIDTMQGGNRQPLITVEGVTDKVINPLKGKSPYGWHFEQQVYDSQGIARAVKANGGSGNIPKVIVDSEPFIVASRGRNPENPSDRTKGIELEQRLEPNCQGISNTLTSVQKDNYVVEPSKLRIRKLTPKECYRLMGFDDESFGKAEQVCSNTQLYKQAGNSIVVDVLEYLFVNLRAYLYTYI